MRRFGYQTPWEDRLYDSGCDLTQYSCHFRNQCQISLTHKQEFLLTALVCLNFLRQIIHSQHPGEILTLFLLKPNRYQHLSKCCGNKKQVDFTGIHCGKQWWKTVLRCWETELPVLPYSSNQWFIILYLHCYPTGSNWAPLVISPRKGPISFWLEICLFSNMMKLPGETQLTLSPDRVSSVDKINHFTKVWLGQPESLLRLLK